MGCRAGPRRRSWQHATGERPWGEVEAQAAGARGVSRKPGSQSLRTERTAVQHGMQGRFGRVVSRWSSKRRAAGSNRLFDKLNC